MDYFKADLPGIEKIKLPTVIKIRQRIPDNGLVNVDTRVKDEMIRVGLKGLLNKGPRVAIAVGSRKIDKLEKVVRTLIREVKRSGGTPFIVPAMGSHGGGDAKGQERVLEAYGITEDLMGAPVISSMEVVSLGKSPNGYPAYMDRKAHDADAIIVVNRVKVHTDFAGDVESGLLKMLAIGLGNSRAPAKLHSYGFKRFPELVPEVGQHVLQKSPVIMGVALVENGHDRLCHVEAILPDKIWDREKELLKKQKRLLPRIPFPSLDILFVDEMGKDISGSGLDTNVIGRAKSANTECKLIIVSKLTPASAGNASGMGMVDIVTRRFLKEIDFSATYTNVLISGLLWDTKLPMVLENDETSIRTAMAFLGLGEKKVRFVRIKNTLELAEMEVTEPLLREVEKNTGIEVVGDLAAMRADPSGNLLGYPYEG